MPNILFLIDTSGSMNQRTFYGTTFLDLAKSAVENFLKVRQRCGAATTDRYMLVTTGDFPRNVKASWKETSLVFLAELKKLRAAGMTRLGDGLKTAFDLLNMNRMVSRIDNYGMGRNPWFLEPTLIICLTDGHTFSSCKGPENELTLPLSNLPGFELTTEPYRWDQRVFSLVLQLPGVNPESLANTANCSNQELSVAGVPVSDNTALNDLCEVTGGRSYKITSMKILNQCLESISQKVQHGVVLKFVSHPRKHPLPGFRKCSNADIHLSNGHCNGAENGEQNLTAFTQCQKLIYVRAAGKTQPPAGHWPIPEPFFPDRSAPSLPPRTAHPEVTVVTEDVEPCEHDVVQADVYEIEPCPMTHMILERKLSNNNIQSCWPVFIANSGAQTSKSDDKLGQSFGYIKPSADSRKVMLHVLPYNYPMLIPLVKELVEKYKSKPSVEWCKRFDAYLSSMPIYYALPMRQALKRINAGHLVPECVDYYQNHSISAYLKRLAHLSKIENDRILALISQQDGTPEFTGINVIPNDARSSGPGQVSTFHQMVSNLTGLDQSSNKSNPSSAINEFAGFTIPPKNESFKPNFFRNPFDIGRERLLTQVLKMRNNFHNIAFWGRPFHQLDSKHSLPISAMGNYQEHLQNKTPPLRDIDPTPVRQHAFGNPYKLAQAANAEMPGSPGRDKMLIADEADDFNEHVVSSKRVPTPVPYRPNKRIRPPSTPPPSANIPNTPDKAPEEVEEIPVKLTKAPPAKQRKVVVDTTNKNAGATLPNGFDNNIADSAWQKRTDKLVHAICRLIRYPTPAAEPSVNELCEKIDGPVPNRMSVIKFLITESERFKRTQITASLKARLKSMQQNALPS